MPRSGFARIALINVQSWFNSLSSSLQQVAIARRDDFSVLSLNMKTEAAAEAGSGNDPIVYRTFVDLRPANSSRRDE